MTGRAKVATHFSSVFCYGGDPAIRSAELKGYPAEEFSPPAGALIVWLIDSLPVAGGVRLLRTV
jgi:hypothetical protein